MDDAECGAGGTIAGHIQSNNDVSWHTLISNGYAVPIDWSRDTLTDEFEQAMNTLGVEDHVLYDFSVDTLDRITTLRDTIYRIWKDYEPDIAYVPWRGSRHQDHRAVADCVYQVSWRGKTDVRAYALPNDLGGFNPSIYSPLTKKEYRKKMLALKCYKSQYHLRSWFSDEMLSAFMRSWGAYVNDRPTEIFEQLRRVI